MGISRKIRSVVVSLHFTIACDIVNAEQNKTDMRDAE